MQYDGKTGLVDMNARWYDPNAGRFMSEDTYPGEMNSPQSLNRYAYTLNNPVNMWDPTGHVAEYVDGGSYDSGLIPSWVREYDSNAEDEIVNGSLYVHLWTPDRSYSGPVVTPGKTQLIDIEDKKTFYRHYLRSQDKTEWHYQYQKYLIQEEYIEKPIGDPKKIVFSETVTKDWYEDISAEDIAKVNQEYIAGLEAPPDAVVKVEQQMNGKTLTKEMLSRHLSKHEGKDSKGASKNLLKSIPFTMDGLHMVLDVLGMTPIGPIADAINSVIYLVEGNWKDAGLSILAALPIVGDVLGGAKIGAKYGDDVLNVINYLKGYLRQNGLYNKLEKVYKSVTAIPWLKPKSKENVDEVVDLGKGINKTETTAIQTYWPPNRGFLGTPKTETLQKGTLIDRYGSEYGSFVSPKGTPFEMRALPLEAKQKPYSVYEVIKPIDATSGKAAPWFGQPGMGTQYEFNKSIKDLINEGVIRRVK
jgi:RHS repeat-associated protein